MAHLNLHITLLYTFFAQISENINVHILLHISGYSPMRLKSNTLSYEISKIKIRII